MVTWLYHYSCQFKIVIPFFFKRKQRITPSLFTYIKYILQLLLLFEQHNLEIYDHGQSSVREHSFLLRQINLDKCMFCVRVSELFFFFFH